jgi:hypothetical protein
VENRRRGPRRSSSAPTAAILADLDALFGLKHLPFALRLSLDAFGELL